VAPIRLIDRAPVALSGGAGSCRQEVDWVAQYRVLVGLEYPPDRRVEACQIVDDLPGKSIKWLTEQGLIEPATGGKPEAKQDAKPSPVKDEEAEV
jgi:hypothetical protein